MDEKHYHVAVAAFRDGRMGLKSSAIKVSPDEDITLGAKRFAYLFFPEDDGWTHHAWDYGRIADHVIVIERAAAHDPSHTMERPDRGTTVLDHD